MLKVLNKRNWVSYLLIAVLGLLLISIRAFQTQLFYDPLLEYFANDSTEKTIPAYDYFSLYSNVVLRYLLNSVISIGILALLFKQKNLTILAVQVYTIVGLLFLVAYMFLTEYDLSAHEKMIFYIRRFLIQPVLLLILIPAYYFILNQDQSKD